jgi:ppGpp synthetase/RelA/SpoT-type nucleotidyltranferase
LGRSELEMLIFRDMIGLRIVCDHESGLSKAVKMAHKSGPVKI